MINEIKSYFFRHRPIYMLPIWIIIGCGIQYLMLLNGNINDVKDAVSTESITLIYQNFSIDIIAFFTLMYCIFCSVSSIPSIIIGGKNSIYPSVKQISPWVVIFNKIAASYFFVLICNAIIILTTSFIAILLYGVDKNVFLNAFFLFVAKAYSSLFYVTVSILVALVLKKYILVLAVFMIIGIIKVITFTNFQDTAIFDYIIFNHSDISFYFNLPSAGVDRGYTLLFSILIYLTYIFSFYCLSVLVLMQKNRSSLQITT